MTTNEIIDLIKVCRDSGVKNFEHDGLKLDFAGTALAQADAVIEKKNFQEHEFRIKEEVLENLRLSDPLAYETLIQFDQSGA